MSKKLFDREVKIRNLSPSTSKRYWGVLQKLEATSGKKITQITEKDIKKYLEREINRGRSGKTYVDAYAFRFYFRGVLGKNWDILVTKQKRGGQRLPQIINAKHVSALANRISDQRIKMIMYLCYGCGLRISEAIALRPKNIRADTMTIQVIGKGDKERQTFLSKKLLLQLREFWKNHRGQAEVDYLFTNDLGRDHISYQTVLAKFVKGRRDLNLPKEITIHSLRHSFATALQANGVDLLTLQYIMGHSSISTTRRYLRISLSISTDIKSPVDDIIIT